MPTTRQNAITISTMPYKNPPQTAEAMEDSVTEDSIMEDSATFIDSHCHLDYFLKQDSSKQDSSKQDSKLANLPPLEEVLTRAYRSNIKTLLTISTELSCQKTLLSICEQYDPENKSDKATISNTYLPSLYSSVGTHPTSLKEEKGAPTTEDILAEHNSNPSRIIAIGESGLDFFRDSNPPASIQLRSFEHHIEAAQELQIPLIVHNRSADLELERILLRTQKAKPYPCVLHCFAGSARLAQVALDLGCFLSFTGLITYNSAYFLQEIIKSTPSKSLLLETDSPFLPPQGSYCSEYGGNKKSSKTSRAPYAEPSMLTITAKHVAKIKNLALSELSAITNENFSSMFFS